NWSVHSSSKALKLLGSISSTRHSRAGGNPFRFQYIGISGCRIRHPAATLDAGLRRNDEREVFNRRSNNHRKDAKIAESLFIFPSFIEQKRYHLLCVLCDSSEAGGEIIRH
ncbi:MAG: hypothetical protein WBG37_15095, partial [Desulfobacterales bacterium]